jgi:uncharacterized protein (DUF427 family)
MAVRAIWNGEVIAESDTTVLLEGNHYFPRQALRMDYLRPSSATSVCPWKGVAHYYDVVVGDQVNPTAAWYYPDTSPAARKIEDHVAFWHGVRIEQDGPPGEASGDGWLSRLRDRLSRTR